MVFTTVRIWQHDSGARSHPFGDDIIDGKFYNFGVQVLAALKAHKTIDVHYPEMDGDPAQEIIIPYHAVLEWSVEKEEGEYPKPEDDFCKSDDNTTYESVVNGTYTFRSLDGMGMYGVGTDKRYVADKIKVTVDGTTATLPLASSSDTMDMWGSLKDDAPSFDKYPAAIRWGCDEQNKPIILITLPTAGEHTVDVSIPTYAESKQCGGDR